MPKSKLPKVEYRRTSITVEGTGEFPLDMMRYDSCVFSHSSDVSTADSGKFKRKVNLERFSYDAGTATVGRWKSFGWDVIQDSGYIK